MKGYIQTRRIFSQIVIIACIRKNAGPYAARVLQDIAILLQRLSMIRLVYSLASIGSSVRYLQLREKRILVFSLLGRNPGGLIYFFVTKLSLSIVVDDCDAPKERIRGKH